MAATSVKIASGLGGSTRLLKLRRPAAAATAARRFSGVVRAAAEESSKVAERLPVALAGLSLGSASIPAAAHAQDASVDTAVTSIIDIVKATGEAVKQGVSAAQTGAEYAKTAYDQVAPVVKSAVDTAAPVVQEGVRAAAQAAAPVVATGLKEAEKALAASGLDTSAAKPLVDTTVATTEQAVTTAKPFVDQALTFLTTTEPSLLAQYAVVAVTAWYLAPPLLRAGVDALRGYAGDITAAQALSAVESDSAVVIVDIRTAREKESAGSPDIPNQSRVIELEYAGIEDRRVRSQLRNSTDLEVRVTALQIAALKRLSKSSKVLLLDRNGSSSKAVARALAERGFGRVFVIKGGFAGWVSSKLRIKPASTVSRVEVLAPGYFGTGSTFSSPAARQLPSGSRSTSGVVTTSSNRRALPSSTGGSQ